MTATQHQPQRAKLLVCVSDFDHSRIALRFACSKAKNTGCPVEVLHVLEPVDYQSFMTVADKMREERREEAEDILKRLSDDAHEWAGVIPSLNLREGLTGEEIIALLEEDHDINMLILATSPESSKGGKLMKWLLSALHGKLDIPILIVPSNLTDQQVRELT